MAADLPPDPGEAGQKAVEGIDSDQNGLHDDIDRFIASNDPNPAKIRAALRQYAKVTQSMMLASEDKEKCQQLAHSLMSAHLCLDDVAGSMDAVDMINLALQSAAACLEA